MILALLNEFLSALRQVGKPPGKTPLLTQCLNAKLSAVCGVRDKGPRNALPMIPMSGPSGAVALRRSK